MWWGWSGAGRGRGHVVKVTGAVAASGESLLWQQCGRRPYWTISTQFVNANAVVREWGKNALGFLGWDGKSAGLLVGGRGKKLYDANVAAGGHVYHSTNFIRAPSAYSIFRALKHHVGCHWYDNFGRYCATWEASMKWESKCCSARRRIQELWAVLGGRVAWMGGQETILKMKVAVKNEMCIFCQNCNWILSQFCSSTHILKYSYLSSGCF